jgi:hypothetical protein
VPAKIAILYPSIAMALLSLGVILSLGARRFTAVQRRQFNPKFYRTFSGESPEPESLRQHSRNAQNQFEIPPLFHLAVWGTYLAGEVTTVTIAAAWFFVVSRAVHSAIHLTYNQVPHRFFVFGLGVVTVLFLWVRLLMGLGHA